MSLLLLSCVAVVWLTVVRLDERVIAAALRPARPRLERLWHRYPRSYELSAILAGGTIVFALLAIAVATASTARVLL